MPSGRADAPIIHKTGMVCKAPYTGGPSGPPAGDGAGNALRGVLGTSGGYVRAFRPTLVIWRTVPYEWGYGFVRFRFQIFELKFPKKKNSDLVNKQEKEVDMAPFHGNQAIPNSIWHRPENEQPGANAPARAPSRFQRLMQRLMQGCSSRNRHSGPYNATNRRPVCAHENSRQSRGRAAVWQRTVWFGACPGADQQSAGSDAQRSMAASWAREMCPSMYRRTAEVTISCMTRLLRLENYSEIAGVFGTTLVWLLCAGRMAGITKCGGYFKIWL